jgi:hypothetical protein
MPHKSSLPAFSRKVSTLLGDLVTVREVLAIHKDEWSKAKTKDFLGNLDAYVRTQVPGLSTWGEPDLKDDEVLYSPATWNLRRDRRLAVCLGVGDPFSQVELFNSAYVALRVPGAWPRAEDFCHVFNSKLKPSRWKYIKEVPGPREDFDEDYPFWTQISYTDHCTDQVFENEKFVQEIVRKVLGIVQLRPQIDRLVVSRFGL